MTEKRDSELDGWLATLRTPEPTAFEMNRWKRAVEAEKPTAIPGWRKWGPDLLKVSVAAGLGFVIGQGVLQPAENTMALRDSPPVFLRATQPEEFANGTKGAMSTGSPTPSASPDAAAKFETIHIKLD